RMVRDLDMPIEIVGCPIVREPDGLAVSSRNRYLSPAQREQACCLSASLRAARERILAGESDPTAIANMMRGMIEAAGPAVIDYVSIVHPDSLEPLESIECRAAIVMAVRIGNTRLIDNLLVDREGQPA
ncbi:MAG: 4-phosphopantoate--beta-alanine ligase, partial [Phycisphaerae bacterium]|nr:4-phosphopantoate--beta-alanine ligase [Phycisphaerae bacterium]